MLKNSDYDDARKSLELTVKCLERLNPSAACLLKEGLEETLTIHKLGLTELLRKTLSTSNPIESCFSVPRTITGRVKRWRGDDMVQRWTVAALLRAEHKFKRVKGYKDIPKLVAALQQRSLVQNGGCGLGLCSKGLSYSNERKGQHRTRRRIWVKSKVG